MASPRKADTAVASGGGHPAIAGVRHASAPGRGCLLSRAAAVLGELGLCHPPISEGIYRPLIVMAILLGTG